MLQAYDILFFGEGNQADRTGRVAASYAENAEVCQILTFMEGQSPRAILRPR